MGKFLFFFLVAILFVACNNSAIDDDQTDHFDRNFLTYNACFRGYLNTLKQDTNLFVTDYEDCFVVVYHGKDTIYSMYIGDSACTVEMFPYDYWSKTRVVETNILGAQKIVQYLVSNWFVF